MKLFLKVSKMVKMENKKEIIIGSLLLAAIIGVAAFEKYKNNVISFINSLSTTTPSSNSTSTSSSSITPSPSTSTSSPSLITTTTSSTTSTPQNTPSTNPYGTTYNVPTTTSNVILSYPQSIKNYSVNLYVNNSTSIGYGITYTYNSPTLAPVVELLVATDPEFNNIIQTISLANIINGVDNTQGIWQIEISEDGVFGYSIQSGQKLYWLLYNSENQTISNVNILDE